MDTLLSVSALMGAISIGYLIATARILTKLVRRTEEVQAEWKEALGKFSDVHNSLATKVAEIEDRLGASSARLDYLSKGKQL